MGSEGSIDKLVDIIERTIQNTTSVVSEIKVLIGGVTTTLTQISTKGIESNIKLEDTVSHIKEVERKIENLSNEILPQAIKELIDDVSKINSSNNKLDEIKKAYELTIDSYKEQRKWWVYSTISLFALCLVLGAGVVIMSIYGPKDGGKVWIEKTIPKAASLIR